MKFNKDTLLGLVFFAGLGLLLVATARLKEWTVLEKPLVLPVFFPSAAGLRPGDAVTVYGMRAGRVKDVRLNPSQDRRDRRIIVEVEMRTPVPFQEGTKYAIAIEDSSFLGGKVVSVDPEAAKNGTPYRRDEPLVGVAYGNPLNQVAEVIAEGGGDLKNILGGLSSVVAKADSDKSSLGALFADRKLYDSILDSAERVNAIIRGAQGGRGMVGGLLTDDQAFQDLKGTLAEIHRTAEGLNARESLLSRAIHDKKLGDDATAVVSDLRALTETARRGEGTLGKIVMDDTLYRQLEEAAREARTLLVEARSGKGILGRLLSDQELGDRLGRVIAGVEEIVAGVRAGEGTLGKIVKDDTIYVQLGLVLRQISRSIEDAREAAPVSTFIQVLGSSFR